MLNLTNFPSLPALANAILASNISAGWWSDRKTGESLIIVNDHGDLLQINRNAGELIALMHSEVDEAFEAQLENTMDDHLLEYSGYMVELADTAIRILDTLAAFKETDVLEEDYFDNNISIDDPKWKMGLSSVHLALSYALEGIRKGSNYKFAEELARALKIVIELGGPYMIDILFIKWNYNKQRADHKLANRNAAGGKQF